jgi:hypothetical protein
MAVSYTCPNPDCGVTLKTPNRVAPGKSVKCPRCARPFVPESGDDAGGTLKLADEPEARKPAKTAAKPEPPKPEPPKPEASKPFADDDDEDAESIKKGYGIVKATDEELEQEAKNKPAFGEVQDKFKRSARGPAQALLVMPSNLLTGEGLLTMAGGVLMFVVGMWPLVFNDAPPGDEEMEEAIVTMLLGSLTFIWGAGICFGASQMQELNSYTWAMAGSVMGVLPLLVGVFGIVMLLNPKVKAGFEESDSGPDDEDEEDEKKKDDEDSEDEDDEDSEDEDEKPRAKKKKAVKKKDDDEDSEDEDEKPRKKGTKKPEPKKGKAKRKDEDD